MSRFIALSFVMTFVVMTSGCATKPSLVFERLLLKEAQESSVELFGETIDKKDARVIYKQHEINSVLRSWKVDPKSLPERVQQALKDKNTVAVLVTRTQPVADKIPRKKSSNLSRVVIVWERWEDFWNGGGGGYWVSSDYGDSSGDNGPCPDGRDYCDHCTGCQGWTERGTRDICVCTNSCDFCRACPRCEKSGGGKIPR